MTEKWVGTKSGVLREEPLLLRACRAGVFGESLAYSGGEIHKALFTYLCGEPDEHILSEHPDLFRGAWLVCMSDGWEKFIRSLPLEQVMRRVMMYPRCATAQTKAASLPEGYTACGFSEDIFYAHPFGQGKNYRDFEEFITYSAGEAVMYGDKVVAAASGFISFENETELDVCTAYEHRRKGLANICIQRLLNGSASRGITVHWDAQNSVSEKLARSHGFSPSSEYAVYVLGQDR